MSYLLQEDAYVQLCKRESCTKMIAAIEALQDTKGIKIAEGSDEIQSSDAVNQNGDEDASLVFVNEWLGAIVDYDIGLLVVQLVSIPKYSSSGRTQLNVDLDYLK